MSETLSVKQGSNYHNLRFRLDHNKQPLDLEFTVVTVYLRDTRTREMKIDGELATADPDQDDNTGWAEYEWSDEDIDTAATYEFEAVVTFPNSKKLKFPEGEKSFEKIVIQESISV